jgi:hypothetical protein
VSEMDANTTLLLRTDFDSSVTPAVLEPAIEETEVPPITVGEVAEDLGGQTFDGIPPRLDALAQKYIGPNYIEELALRNT